MATTKDLNRFASILDNLYVDSDDYGNIYINKRPDTYYSEDGTGSWEVYSEKSLKESLVKAAKQLIDEGEDPEDILEEVELAVKDHKKKARKHCKKQKENLNLWKNLTK